MIKAQPRRKTPRDSHYLAWIRKQPCELCRKTPAGDSHHTASAGMSLVGSDYSALGLCRECHSRMHNNEGKKHHWKPEELEAITSGLLARFKEIHRDDPKRLQHIEEQLANAW